MKSYFQLAIAFAGIALLGCISKKLKSFFPPFYILAGILLGPFVLEVVTDQQLIDLFAEIGVVFLPFL